MTHDPNAVAKNKAIYIGSEVLEAVASDLIAKWYTRCLLAGTFCELRKAALAYWDGILGLEKIANASPTAVHFQIFMRNQRTLAEKYLREKMTQHYLPGKLE